MVSIFSILIFSLTLCSALNCFGQERVQVHTPRGDDNDDEHMVRTQTSDETLEQKIAILDAMSDSILKGQGYAHILRSLGKSGDVNLRSRAMIGMGKLKFQDPDDPINANELFENAYMELTKHNGDISLRIRALNELTKNFCNENGNDAAKVIDRYFEVLNLLNTNRDLLSLALPVWRLLTKAGYHINQNDFCFIDWYKHVLIKHPHEKELRAFALIGLGDARCSGKADRPYAHRYEDALSLLGENGDTDLRTQALIGLGDAKHTESPGHESHIAWYTDALNLLGENGDVQLRARAFIGLGDAKYKDEKESFYPDPVNTVYLGAVKLGLFNNYASWYLKAFKLLKPAHFTVAMRTLLARSFLGLGEAQYRDAETTKHTDWYQKALDLLGENGDAELQCKAFQLLEAAGIAIDARRQSLATFKKAWLTTPDEHQRARAMVGLGDTRCPGQNDKPYTEWYTAALGHLGDTGDAQLRARALIGLGDAKCQGQSGKPYTERYEKAISILGSTGDVRLRARALIGLGNAKYQGQNDKPYTDWYEKAISILGADGDKNLQARAMIGLGDAKYPGQNDKPYTDWYEKAISILGENGDKNLQARAMIGLGDAKYPGQNNKPYTVWYEKAISILGENGDAELRARAFLGLGDAKYQGQSDKPYTDWYEKAISILGENGDAELRARAMIGLGDAKYSGQAHKLYTAWYTDALNLLGNDGNKVLRARALIGLGNAKYQGENNKPYADWYLDALSLLGQYGDKALQARALIGLGDAQSPEADKPYSERYENALNLLGEDGDRALRVQAYLGLGRANHKGNSTQWYVKALKESEGNQDINLKAGIWLALGRDKYIGENNKSHTDWFEKVLDELKTGNENWRAEAMIELGEARHRGPKGQSYTTWYRNALDLLGTNGDSYLKAKALIGLAEAASCNPNQTKTENESSCSIM